MLGYVAMARLNLFRGAVTGLVLSMTIALTRMFLYITMTLMNLFRGAVALCRTLFRMDTIGVFRHIHLLLFFSDGRFIGEELPSQQLGDQLAVAAKLFWIQEVMQVVAAPLAVGASSEYRQKQDTIRRDTLLKDG